MPKTSSKEWREQLVPYFENGVHPSVEVGNGWKNIVLEMVKRIKELGVDVRIISLKEKFGDLNFVYSVPTDTDPETQEKIIRVVHEAERESRYTCSLCGTPDADVCSINYIPHVYCDVCKEARKQELGKNEPIIA